MARVFRPTFEQLIDFAEASRGLAPTISVKVQGADLPIETIEAISKVEVNLDREMADQIKITVANPFIDQLGAGYGSDSGRMAFIDSKAFVPGNRIDVFMGYDNQNEHVASGIIQKWLPDFPRSGFPTLDIQALDGSVLLMDGPDTKIARSYPNFDLDTIVKEVINRRGILPGQIDPLVHTGQASLHKKEGMSDFQFVKGLANLTGFEFRVFWDTKKSAWVANWRKPVSDQAVKYVFTYGTEAATLMQFQPQWGLRDFPSEVKVLYFDKSSRTWEEVNVGDKTPGSDLKYPGKSVKSQQQFLNSGVIAQEITRMEQIRIAAGGVAVDVEPSRAFDDARSAQRYAERWIRQHRDNFITGEGELVGFPGLRPGDVHTLKGIGAQLSGDWEFSSITHLFRRQGGFETSFFANKVMT